MMYGIVQTLRGESLKKIIDLKIPSSVFYNFDSFTIEAIPLHQVLKKSGGRFL